MVLTSKRAPVRSASLYDLTLRRIYDVRHLRRPVLARRARWGVLLDTGEELRCPGAGSGKPRFQQEDRAGSGNGKTAGKVSIQCGSQGATIYFPQYRAGESGEDHARSDIENTADWRGKRGPYPAECRYRCRREGVSNAQKTGWDLGYWELQVGRVAHRASGGMYASTCCFGT